MHTYDSLQAQAQAQAQARLLPHLCLPYAAGCLLYKASHPHHPCGYLSGRGELAGCDGGPITWCDGSQANGYILLENDAIACAYMVRWRKQ